MIPTSDLRKGNLIKTEYGILPVHHIVFDDIYVKGKDGRVLYVREVEGVGIGEINIANVGESMVAKILRRWLFVHEMQNWYYWNYRKEITIIL